MKAPLALLAAGAALTVAQAAGANPPSVQIHDFTQESTSLSPCGFEVTNAGSIHYVMRIFTDGTGAPVKYQLHTSAVGTFTGPTGLIADWSSTYVLTTDPATGIRSSDGMMTKVWAPRAGVLLQAAGRIVEDAGSWPPTTIATAGHPTLEPGAWDAVCAYLAGT